MNETNYKINNTKTKRGKGMRTIILSMLLTTAICNAQNNFTLEWTSPANEGCYGIFNTEKNNQIPEIITIVGNHPNEQYKIYDGATKNLKRTINALGDSSYLSIRYFSPTYSIDVNNDGIYEIIAIRSGYYTTNRYLKVLNGATGSVLFTYNAVSEYVDFYLTDIDGDNFIELCIPDNGRLKIFSTTATIGLTNSSITPTEYELKQNYPNPFNPTTTIEYSVKSKADVSIILYDVLGREVKTLVQGIQNPGTHKVSLDGQNLSSGTYFYQIIVDGMTESRKMVLVK